MNMSERIVRTAWLLAIPCSLWALLYYLTTYRKISLNPFRPWLIGVGVALMMANLFFLASNNNRIANVFYMGYWSILGVAGWIHRRAFFATVRGAWWQQARFTIPQTVRIPVKNVTDVSPWYTQKLGLQPVDHFPDYQEQEAAVYQFHQDGNSIVLAPHNKFENQKTPMLFTNRIVRMRKILSSRGIEAGKVERDPQGIRFFERLKLSRSRLLTPLASPLQTLQTS
jgi:hypothetical protein